MFNNQSERIVFRVLFCVAYLLCSTHGAYATDFPKTLEEFASGFKPISCEFMGVSNWGHSIDFVIDGQRVDLTVQGDLDALSKWDEELEQSKIERDFEMSYSVRDGVLVKDLISGKQFSVLGFLENHPIDVAAWSWPNTSSSQDNALMRFRIDAWNAEIERVYLALDSPLLIEAWKAYSDSYKKMLVESVASQQGTKWTGIVLMGMLNFTKRNAEAVQKHFDLAQIN